MRQLQSQTVSTCRESAKILCTKKLMLNVGEIDTGLAVNMKKKIYSNLFFSYDLKENWKNDKIV